MQQMNRNPAPVQQTRTMNQTDWSGEVTNHPATMPNSASMQGGQMRPSTVIRFDDPEAVRESGMNPAAVPLRTTAPELDMQNNLPADVILSPTSLEEARVGSLKAMLSRNEGNYIVATFLVGTQNMVSWEGILYDVGNDYLTIYQEARNRYIVSDYYSLKFIEFYDTRCQELCNSMTESGEWQMRNRNIR